MIADRLHRLGCVLVLAGVAACGGGEEAPAATPPPRPAGAAAAEAPAAAPDTAPVAQDTLDTSLRREAFNYRGATRDPFKSLVGGALRPDPRDLRITGITYDARYPQRSVATVRDTTDGKRYSLRVGDQVGRLRIVEIRQSQVVIVMEDFGVERQVVLSLRRRQEGTP